MKILATTRIPSRLRPSAQPMLPVWAIAFQFAAAFEPGAVEMIDKL